MSTGIDGRCGECGSPVRLNHYMKFTCSRDESHMAPVALCGGKGGHPGPCPGDHPTAAPPDHVELQKSNITPSPEGGALKVMDTKGAQHTFSRVNKPSGGWDWVHQASGKVAGSREGNRLDIAAHNNGVKFEEFAFGGPGSGWSAASGHVKGSQGGKDAHGGAKDAHEAAAASHETAAKAYEKMDPSSRVPRGAIAKEAGADTAAAAKATKSTGSKPYEAEAASTYSKMALESTDPTTRAMYHREAAKYHRGAARRHDSMVKERPNLDPEQVAYARAPKDGLGRPRSK